MNFDSEGVQFLRKIRLASISGFVLIGMSDGRNFKNKHSRIILYYEILFFGAITIFVATHI